APTVNGQQRTCARHHTPLDTETHDREQHRVVRAGDVKKRPTRTTVDGPEHDLIVQPHGRARGHEADLGSRTGNVTHLADLLDLDPAFDPGLTAIGRLEQVSPVPIV